MRQVEDLCWVSASELPVCGRHVHVLTITCSSHAGPQVYGVAYCPIAYSDGLKALGFAGDCCCCCALYNETTALTRNTDPPTMIFPTPRRQQDPDARQASRTDGGAHERTGAREPSRVRRAGDAPPGYRSKHADEEQLLSVSGSCLKVDGADAATIEVPLMSRFLG